MKESLEMKKIRDQEQQLSTQRYEDFTYKLLIILVYSERLSDHIPCNIHRSVPTHHLPNNFEGNSNTNTQQTITLKNIPPFAIGNDVTRANNHYYPMIQHINSIPN
jgi:hypothetical protein